MKLARFWNAWALLKGRRPPRDVTKRMNYHRQRVRKALVYFAGKRGLEAFADQVSELRDLETLRTIKVPRSLRGLLGAELGGLK